MLASAPLPHTEAARIEAWRLERFLARGAPVLLAERLARSPQVDHHEFARLRERGCAVILAAEILL